MMGSPLWRRLLRCPVQGEWAQTRVKMEEALNQVVIMLLGMWGGIPAVLFFPSLTTPASFRGGLSRLEPSWILDVLLWLAFTLGEPCKEIQAFSDVWMRRKEGQNRDIIESLGDLLIALLVLIKNELQRWGMSSNIAMCLPSDHFLLLIKFFTIYYYCEGLPGFFSQPQPLDAAIYLQG